MSVLSASERKLLSDVVVRARGVVEGACAQRVVSLGVGSERAPEALAESDRALRRGLRARARQLGSVDALVAEAAFEHWHRMLFARFLVDNGLLVDDVAGAPVSTGELAEWAVELGEADRWEVAARFAAAMLPGIFRRDDPVLAMRLPAEARQELESLLGLLPVDVIRADDALGWVYQYWQSQRKDEVNRSGDKVGGADLAPVTQLFTEDYMVRFLLENSLGAWWAARHPGSPLVGGWEFLRLEESGAPAAGEFGEWPERAADITVMDPCCGSGHFLVAAFDMLWRMRAEEEGLSVSVAQDAVLRENLFGLELDARCTQIAAFALALAAWKSGGYRQLPVPNVACSGIPARAPLSDWIALAGGDAHVEAALGRLHALFVNADSLGSLIDPVRAAEEAGLESADWHEVSPLVQQALTAEAGRQADDPTAAVFGEAAAAIARTAAYLSRKYTLIATNVPYLGRGKQSPVLTTHGDHTQDASGDLATLMMDRCLSMMSRGSLLAVVAPQSWLSQSGFRSLRRRWFADFGWPLVARLGGGAFAGISGEVVQVVLALATERRVRTFRAMTAESAESPAEKAELLRSESPLVGNLDSVLATPDCRVPFGAANEAPRLGEIAEGGVGVQTGDNDRFTRAHWEMQDFGSAWIRMSRAPSGEGVYSGATRLLRWESGHGSLHAFVRQRLGGMSVAAWIRGEALWEREGILVSRMGELPAALYAGGAFADNCMVIAPDDREVLPALWCFAQSGSLAQAVRAFDLGLSVTPGSVLDAPFDRAHWQQVARERYPEGLPEAWSDDPTQWLFRGAVRGSTEPLQVAVARLLGFRWPDQEPGELDALADGDGIVCLPAVGGEAEAVDRLRAFLEAAYEDRWSPALLDELLAGVGAKPGVDGLRRWLRDGFFKDHCRVFANRPFIWQVWDGNPAGFSALVNYHRLDRNLLGRLTHDILGSWWMTKVRDEARSGLPGADGRVKAAEGLKSKLEAILEGEPPYDIFVRWKSLAEQPIGWAPDLDDGVRLNIRPFMAAGVLRAQPKIKWDKDRGKNPDGSERLNDLHLTNKQKRQARQGGTQ